ncbi:MAG: hypothetical protein V3S51_02070, partial [Dehalococcoidia bacterium]
MSNPAAESLEAQSMSGFRSNSDPIAHERHLAAAVIFLAWKDAVEGDEGAFRFALDDGTMFTLWCRVCGLDLDAVRACFARLRRGDRIEPPVVDYRRRWVPNVLSLPEVRHAVRLFIKVSHTTNNRKEVFTWIALEMEKKVQAIENLFFMLARRAKSRKSNIYLVGLKR